MKEESKRCYNCMFYSSLYTKGFCRFDKRKWGVCKSKNVVEKDYVCGKWEYRNDFNKSVKKELTQRAVIKSLDETIKNLTEVSQILKEEHEED